MSSAGKSPTSTSGINRLRWGVRSLSSAILAAVGRDVQPEGHPDVTVTTRLRDDMRSVTWSAVDTQGHPFLVRACRATALAPHVAAFKASALLLKKLHDEGPIDGLLPVLSVSEDGHSFLMPSLTMGTVLEVAALGWEVDRTMTFFVALARTVAALHEAGHVIGRWSAGDVLLDDELTPVLACDIDATKGLPYDAKERDFFAPEVTKGELVDARSDVFTLGKILEVLVQHAQVGLGDAAKSEGFATLVKVVEQATAARPEDRYETVDKLIRAVEASIEVLPEGHLAPDRFELESLPPPPPKAPSKPVVRPAAIAPPSLDIFPTEAAAPDAEPPRLELLWVGVTAAILVVACVLAFLVDPSEGATALLLWGSAFGATVGLVRATGRFPLRARVAVALATFILIITFDPVGPSAAAGIRHRLDGDRIARESQVKTLLKRGRKSFPGQNLSEVSLAGMNLVLVDVSSGDLSRANLSRANLGGLIVDHTNLADASLTGADLTDVDLSVAVGWETATCDGGTKLPSRWTCRDGHLAKADDAKR
jgi:hypothetical protein